MSAEWSKLLPDPATFSVEEVKRSNATGWQLLGIVVAGHPIQDVQRMPPDSADRARAAAVLQKGLEILVAEAIDETRASDPERAKQVAYKLANLTVEDLMGAYRVQIARPKSEGREFMAATIFAHEVLKRYRANPAEVVTSEEIMAIREEIAAIED